MLKQLITAAVFLIITAQPALAKPLFAVLTGLSGDFAPMGEDVKRGFELASSLYSTPPDLFVYEDTQANVKMALSAYEKVTAANKLLAVYAIRSPIGLALKAQTNRDGMPLLGGVAHNKFTKDNKYAFGIWATSKQEGKFLADYLKSKQLNERLCIISSADEWLIDLSESLKSALDAPPVFDEIVEPTEMDLRSLLTRAKTKNCSALFLNVTIAQYAPALKRSNEAKLGISTFGNFWLQKPEVLNVAGIEATEGLVFAEIQTDIPDFISAYSKRFNNSKPTAASVSGFIAGLLMLETNRLFPEAKTSRDFYNRLLEITEVSGLGYNVKIVDRAAQFPLSMNKIVAGRVVRVSTK